MLPMRRLLIVFLLVLLPLRGWTAGAMALDVMPQAATTAAHALCPDHAEADRSDAAEPAPDSPHAHCTACQLPALALPTLQIAAPVLPTATPAARPVALIEPTHRPLIKPPIA